MVTLYRREVGNDKLTRIKNLIAAYPYLLRHHVRSGCLCNDDSSVDERYRLVLQEPSTRIVDTRYEGDKSSGGVYRPETLVTRPPRQCWVDRRDLPWCLLEPGATLLKVARSQNRPLWVCDRLGKEIMSIPYGPNYTSRERLKLLDHVDKLTNAIGQCERIHQTAVPLNYARHALRSLTLWLFTLPFALVKDLGLLTAPIVGVIAWLLFGVYQIGHSIEDPFQGHCDYRFYVMPFVGMSWVRSFPGNRHLAWKTLGKKMTMTTKRMRRILIMPIKHRWRIFFRLRPNEICRAL